MGADKALLRFGDRTFLEIALQNARVVCPGPIIVGSRQLYSEYGEVIEDQFTGCGPLGGIHAALSFTTSELNLVLSVDMPLMDPRFLQWLTAQAAGSPEQVTVPRCGSRLQPLCAVYRRAILPHIESALARKQYKVEAAFVGGRVVQEGELTYAGFSVDIFRNINRPYEYESLMPSSAAPAPAKESAQ